MSTYDQAMKAMQARVVTPDPEHTPDSAYQLGMKSTDQEEMETIINFLEDSGVTGAAGLVRTRLVQGLASGLFVKPGTKMAFPAVKKSASGGGASAVARMIGQVAPQSSVPVVTMQPQAATAPSLPHAQPPALSDESAEKMMTEADAKTAHSIAGLLEFHGRSEMAKTLRATFPKPKDD